ncbi:CBL-interacting serine/threonine-protein kinase 23 [Spatholobus suberectus]|nr:CBL-interacting serine/threonine-protein kinase 23 [Spatholobus suberectus]
MAHAHGSSSGSNTNRTIRVGRYELSDTLGRGNSSVVKRARHLVTGDSVAIKIKREISIMKMIRHPNVVRLIEVMATRTKIYIVLELITGGELFGKITSMAGMTEGQARKYFHQLICAVDYCHTRGVSHRDLKPENLLVDTNEVLKVSDFGLSALPQQIQQDGLLHTACGTLHYTAPEVLSNIGYEGAKADIWSCGVILFFMNAGYLPFTSDNNDRAVLYGKISRADFTCPPFFSSRLRRLITRILDPNPTTRITINEIFEDEWFNKNYQPPRFSQENISFDNVSASFSETAVKSFAGPSAPGAPVAMNAFEILNTFLGFNLIGNLFNQVRVKKETRFISQSPANEIISGIEYVAETFGFNVNKRNYQIYEMAPPFHMVEFRKAGGDTLEFHRFYKDLSAGLQDIIWKAEPIDAETDG